MERSPIIFRMQETDHYCGPAVVHMILATYGIETAQSILAEEMGTDSHGTPVRSMQNCLVEQGFSSKLSNNASWEDIEDALGAGDMVIVGYIERGEEHGHYAIVETITGSEIVLADPWHGPHTRVWRDDFERNWKDDEDGAYGARMMLAVSAPKGV